MDEKTKLDEANHRLYSSMFVKISSTFLKFQMRIHLILGWPQLTDNLC